MHLYNCVCTQIWKFQKPAVFIFLELWETSEFINYLSGNPCHGLKLPSKLLPIFLTGDLVIRNIAVLKSVDELFHFTIGVFCKVSLWVTGFWAWSSMVLKEHCQGWDTNQVTVLEVWFMCCMVLVSKGVSDLSSYNNERNLCFSLRLVWWRHGRRRTAVSVIWQNYALWSLADWGEVQSTRPLSSCLGCRNASVCAFFKVAVWWAQSIRKSASKLPLLVQRSALPRLLLGPLSAQHWKMNQMTCGSV